MPTPDAQRQGEYRQRVADSGRTKMTIVVSNEMADLIKSLAVGCAMPLGRALEGVLHARHLAWRDTGDGRVP